MPEKRPRAALPVLFSVVIVDLIGFGIVMPILPFYALEFGASGTELGLLGTSYAAAQFSFAPWWGRLSDRVGRRPVLLSTITGTGVALLLLALSQSLLWMLVMRTLAGVFAANIGVASAYISDVTDESERTRFMGVLGACFGVGFVLGPAIGGLLAPYGHDVPIFAAAALAAVNAIYAFFVLREPDSLRAAAHDGAGRWQVLADPGIRRLCLTYFIFSVAVTQLENMFAFFMADRFGYGAQRVAFLLVAMAVLMGGIQGGGMKALSARYAERSLVLTGSAMLAVAFVAIVWAPSVALLLIPLSLSAVGRGIAQPALMGLASFAATENRRGVVMGTFQSSASLARVVGPITAGILYDRAIAAPFLLAAALMVVVTALATRIPGSKPITSSS